VRQRQLLLRVLLQLQHASLLLLLLPRLLHQHHRHACYLP
jgi:hypothetical protein